MNKKLIAGFVGMAAALAFATTAMAATFTTTLKMGSTGQSVKDLQVVLNSDVATQVAATGVGSAGNESTYFGGLTKAAVIKFQEKFASDILTPIGLTSGTGVVGPSTRAKLNAMSGSMTTGTLPTGCTSTVGFSPVTGQSCSTGVMTTTYPAGCTSAVGFSPTTGVSCSTGVVVSATGPVSAMLSLNTPASGVILDGQATADLTHFTFTGNGTVSSMTLKRSGISNQNALTNVYLYDGATRLTDGYSFNNNGDIVMNNLNIAVNGSRTISVMADVAAAAASTNASVAVGLTSFTADGTAVAASLVGNTHSFVVGSILGTVSFTSANTVTGSPTVNAGTMGYTFWSAPIQVNTRALQLKSAAFRMVGSAPSDALANIRLVVDGADTGKVATVVSIQGSNYAMFDLTSAPVALSTGAHTLDVRADVMKGSNRTVQVSLQQAADLMITDAQVGVNVSVGTTNVPNSGATITISAGSVTTTVDPSFTSVSTVTGGASSVVLGKFKLQAYGEDVKVSSLLVTPAFTTTPLQGAYGFTNVGLFYNGSQVGSSATITGVTATTFQLGSSLILTAGTAGILEVRADTKTSTSTNYTSGVVTIALTNNSALNGQGQSSYTTMNVPATTVTTTGLTITTGALSIAAAPGYTNQTVNPNTANVKIGSYVIQNTSSSESVRITNLAVAANVVTMALTNLSNLRTSETSGSGATPINPSATNNFSVNFTLAPGVTKTIDIFADLGGATSGTASTTLLVSAIGASSNVSLTPSSATVGQTVTVATGSLANPTFVVSGSYPAQFIAGATGTGKSVARFNFVATNGVATVTELTLLASASAGTPVSSVQIGATGTPAPVVNGSAYITGLNLVVPNGGAGLDVDVYSNYGAVGTNGVTTGTTASTSISVMKYTIGGITTTSGTLTTATSTIMKLVGSKPVLAVTTTSGTGLIVGENKLMDVNVTADAAGTISVNTLVFNTSTTTSITGLSAARLADGSTTISGSSCAVTAGVITCTLPSGYNIAGGSTKTFSLFATAAASGGLGAGGTSNITTSLAASSLFSWTDVVGGGSAITSANTTYLTNYPTQTWTRSN